jgi:hypothetical protein
VETCLSFVKLNAPSYTREYTVVNLESVRYFADQGDSAAVAFDERAQASGMVMGTTIGKRKEITGHESLGHLMVSYITPMSVITDRIKAVTGKDATVIVQNLDELIGGKGLIRTEEKDLP